MPSDIRVTAQAHAASLRYDEGLMNKWGLHRPACTSGLDFLVTNTGISARFPGPYRHGMAMWRFERASAWSPLATLYGSPGMWRVWRSGRLAPPCTTRCMVSEGVAEGGV